MLRNILFHLLFVNLVQGQINGEFWWLNAKLNNLLNVKPAAPKVDIKDFENDNSKIIFRDDDWFTNKLKPIRDRASKLMPNNNNEVNKIVWPKDEHMKSHNVEVFTVQNLTEKPVHPKPSKIKSKFEDVLIFSYPKNDKFVTVHSNKASVPVEPTSTSTQSATEVPVTSTMKNLLSAYKLPPLSTIITKDGESQNICTYTTRKKCYQFDGFVYEYARRVPATSGEKPLICCILPIQPILYKNNLSDTIYFSPTNRSKRSNNETNNALKQRDFLLKQKFTPQQQNVKPASTPLTKIVTLPEDDYVDPYWNVKNTKVAKPNQGNTKYMDYSEDSQEYVDELPKPGLVGLYSDHIPSPSSWPFAVGNKPFIYGGSDDDYEEEGEDDDNGDTFGYSTIGPRQGIKKQGQKVRPTKLTTTSDDQTFDAERHTISFSSNPDFHVFQGFKLLNLFRNTSRVYTKNTAQDRDKHVLVGSPEDNEENEDVFDEKQLYEYCGRVETKKTNERGNIGDAANGSHPWMALVVLTKRQHNVLCYATLVHPRAAVTVGDCTQGTAHGDVTVIFGLWDLHERSRAKSRVATMHIHPGYTPGEVENNLAILYWIRSLKLSANIQPACLAQPQFGEECKYFGWSGIDKGFQQPRPRWQRVTSRACTSRQATARRTKATSAFCVSATRGIVTGLGGPLICEIAGRSSVAGIVVTRENGYVLSPVRDWVMKMDTLVGD